MAVTAEVLDRTQGVVALEGHRNGHVQDIDILASIRKGLAQNRWNNIMRGFGVVEQEAEFDERYSDRNFMERYRELGKGDAIGKQKMPWLYR